MNWVLALILCLYPKNWRERYEDEFRAMLELCDLSLMDWLDITFTAYETRYIYSKGQIMKDLLNRLTGLIALISALGFVSVFFISDEGTAEFMLLVSPMLSILLIPALHRILKVHYPKLSRMVMMIGVIAIGLLSIAFVINALDADSRLVGLTATISIVMVGVWLIGANLLAIRSKILPSMLATIGVIAGISWIVVMGVTLSVSFTGFQLHDYAVFNALYMTSLFALLAGYFIWALGTGFYFITGTVSRKLRLAY